MIHPKISPTSLALRESVGLYQDDLFALSKMCYQLIGSQALDEIHCEYKMILKDKNILHQIICGVSSEGNVLGCIDPIYRHGKPLNYQMDSRHMILAMCDSNSLSNTDFHRFPIFKTIKAQGAKQTSFKVEQFEFIPLSAVQCKEVHFTRRPYIEFNHVDTFNPLSAFLEPEGPVVVPTVYNFPPPPIMRDPFDFTDLMGSMINCHNAPKM